MLQASVTPGMVEHTLYQFIIYLPVNSTIANFYPIARLLFSYHKTTACVDIIRNDFDVSNLSKI